MNRNRQVAEFCDSRDDTQRSIECLDDRPELVESIGYDTAYTLTPLSRISDAGCVVELLPESEVRINGDVFGRIMPNRGGFKLKLHLAGMLHQPNLPLVQPDEVLKALDGYSSLLGFDTSKERLVGVAFAGDIRLTEIVRNSFSTIRPKYNRILKRIGEHTIYVNSPAGQHAAVERVFYDKGYDILKADSTLLRFELRYLKNLIREVGFVSHSSTPITSDLADPFVFERLHLRWLRELELCIPTSTLQSILGKQ